MGAELTSERHEAPSVRTSRVLALVLGFMAFAVLLGGGLGLYYRWIVSGEKLTSTLRDFPAPRLQPNPTQDWETFHKGASRDARAAELGGSGPDHHPCARSSAPWRSSMPVVQQAYDPVEGTPPFVTSSGAPLDGAPRPRRAPASPLWGP